VLLQIQSSVTWRHTTRRLFLDVSKDHSAFISGIQHGQEELHLQCKQNKKKISFDCLPLRSTTVFQNIRSYSSNEYGNTFPEDLKLRPRHHDKMKPITRDHRAVVCHDSLTSKCLKWQPLSQALGVLQSTCISHNSARNLSSATVLTLRCITL